MANQIIRRKLQKLFHQDVSSISSVSGGYSSQAFRVALAGGKEVFCKIGPSAKTVFLTEANGLRELSKARILGVPEVYSVDEDIIVLEFISAAKPTFRNCFELGRGMAELHKITSDSFGFYEDNFIGSMPQKNTPQASPQEMAWSEFFFHRRLVFQLRLSESKNQPLPDVARALAALESKIHKVIGNDGEPPCLLHGDMWGGNHLLSRDGRYYVFDPAVYYGHREADIALTSLFGGFSAEFYRGYGESYPLAHGWEYRQGIYQAYHLLNHHNMMGGSYARQAYELLSS